MKKELSIFKRLLVTGLIIVGLTACSSGGGDDNNTIEKPVEISNLGFFPISAKTFRFQWTDVSNATHYKLLENPDSASGFTQVGADIPQGTETIDHIVPLYARVNAEYLLQSCNTAGCSDSAVKSIAEFISQGGSIGQAAGKLEAGNGDTDDVFGLTVSISADGSTLAIGAPYESSNATGINGSENNNDAEGSGAVYIFTRNGSSWEQQAYLKNSLIVATALFGYSVSLSSDGNTLAAGIYLKDSVSIFSRDGENWTLQQELTPDVGDSGDSFGGVVSLSADGNTLAVGAHSESSVIGSDPNDNSAPGAGAAYVFARSGATWIQMAYIKPPNLSQSGDQFGGNLHLSADGNTLAVGAASSDDIPANIENIGNVHIFTRQAAAWSHEARLSANTPSANGRFGSSVSFSGDGDLLAVGAPGEDNDTGAAYLFARSAGTWLSTHRLVSTFRDEGDAFGLVKLSPDGTTLAVSAAGEDGNGSDINRNQDNNSLEQSGAVFIYKRADDWTEATYIKVGGSEANDFTGSTSLASDGTLVVGVVGRDTYTGVVYLY